MVKGVLKPIVQLNVALEVSRSTSALPLLHLACAVMSVGWLKVFLSVGCCIVSASQYHRLAIILPGMCFNVGRVVEGVLEPMVQLNDVL